MSSKADIWMPLYIGDYLRDTTRLTTAQHGAYMLLIMDYWTNGGLPDDDEILQTITKTNKKEWEKIRPALIEKFDVIDGYWKHNRIEREMAEANIHKQKRQERSQKANQAKAEKQALKDTYKETYEDTSKATPSPSPSPSPIIISEEAYASLSGSSFPPCPHGQILELYAKHLPHLPQHRTWEGRRQANLRARWVQASKPSSYSPVGYTTGKDGLDWWSDFFRYIAEDTKLAKGFETNGRIWVPDLEWMIKAENFNKIIDGKYDK